MTGSQEVRAQGCALEDSAAWPRATRPCIGMCGAPWVHTRTHQYQSLGFVSWTPNVSCC